MLRSCVHLISRVTSGRDYIARDCHSNRRVKPQKNSGGKGGRRHADEPRTAKRRTIRRATAKGGGEPSRKPPAVFVKRLAPCNDCSRTERRETRDIPLDGTTVYREGAPAAVHTALRVHTATHRTLSNSNDYSRSNPNTHDRARTIQYQVHDPLSVPTSTWNRANDAACPSILFIRLCSFIVFDAAMSAFSSPSTFSHHLF